jgi:aminopeptidase
MIPDFEAKLEAYANLIVKRGVALEPGQTVMLTAPVEAYDFARRVQRVCYEHGARDILLRWVDHGGSILRLKHVTMETLTDIPQWFADSYNDYAREDVVFIALDTEFPPEKGVDEDKVSQSAIARMKATEPFKESRMKAVVRWNISSVATKEWASMVYPDLDADEAVERLWHDVLSCTRCLTDDPIVAWDEHVARNDAYRDKLNNAQFTSLHFTSGLGTDLVVGLPKGYRFCATQETGSDGTLFIANMPSEEIFGPPDRLRVDGTVVASMPLLYNNKKVEGLRFEFKDGKAVSFHADQGADAIEKLLATDEGSSYLGEVALVPHDSTVSNTGKLFYTTLYDENASCHLALGEAYPDTIAGGLEMTREERIAAGLNYSLEHVDFMFGTADMSIVGTTEDGEQIAVFTDGNWAL